MTRARTNSKSKIRARKKTKKIVKPKKLTTKQLWKAKFFEKVKLVHKRKLDKFANRLLNRAASAKNSMVQRSKKKGIYCNITLEETRELIFECYGKKCRYCNKILNINTLAFDHIIPVSKGGPTTKKNIQIICKTSNTMKGSLIEEDFQLLLDWLETIPPHVKKDISIRLSRGIH